MEPSSAEGTKNWQLCVGSSERVLSRFTGSDYGSNLVTFFASQTATLKIEGNKLDFRTSASEVGVHKITGFWKRRHNVPCCCCLYNTVVLRPLSGEANFFLALTRGVNPVLMVLSHHSNTVTEHSSQSCTVQTLEWRWPLDFHTLHQTYSNLPTVVIILEY